MRQQSTLFALTNAIQPVRRAWMQAVARSFEWTAISPSLAMTVLIASRCGPKIQQKILALEVGINPAALVRLLDQGEAAGLLMRSDVAGDRRSKAIDLLPEGQILVDRMERTLSDLRLTLLGDVPEADITTATRVLRLLEERVGAWLRDGSTLS